MYSKTYELLGSNRTTNLTDRDQNLFCFVSLKSSLVFNYLVINTIRGMIISQWLHNNNNIRVGCTDRSLTKQYRYQTL